MGSHRRLPAPDISVGKDFPEEAARRLRLKESAMEGVETESGNQGWADYVLSRKNPFNCP